MKDLNSEGTWVDFDWQTYESTTETVLPQKVIQSAKTWGWLGVDFVISSIQANRVLLETQELLFVSQNASVVRVTDVIRVGQPLHVVLVCACKHYQCINPQDGDSQMKMPFVQNAWFCHSQFLVMRSLKSMVKEIQYWWNREDL